MTHIVIGYPSLEASERVVQAMVDAGVDLIELQIPFTEPLADGPVIAQANQLALEQGIHVNDCFEFAQAMAARHSIPFLLMSYFNILYKCGLQRFVERAVRAGIKGAIVPDLPPEEGAEYLSVAQDQKLEPIFLFSPRTPDARLRTIAKHARGFVYCVARTGITGSVTSFSEELDRYLARCRLATQLPLAVGFGVKRREDVDFLQDRADIAVIGSEGMRRLSQGGPAAVGEFLGKLRA